RAYRINDNAAQVIVDQYGGKDALDASVLALATGQKLTAKTRDTMRPEVSSLIKDVVDGLRAELDRNHESTCRERGEELVTLGAATSAASKEAAAAQEQSDLVRTATQLVSDRLNQQDAAPVVTLSSSNLTIEYNLMPWALTGGWALSAFYVHVADIVPM